MKLKSAFSLMLCFFLLCSPVLAQTESEQMQAALTKAKTILTVPEDYTEFSYQSETDTDGTVYADGTAVDRVRLTDFENYDYLKKFGETMYQPVQGAVEKEATGSILQGYTEQSNVNVVSEMVNLINITRAYEANQKVIKAMDDLLQIDVSSVGKI